MYPATLSETSFDFEFSCTVSSLGRVDSTSSISFPVASLYFQSSFSEGSILKTSFTRILIFRIFSDRITSLMDVMRSLQTLGDIGHIFSQEDRSGI